MQSGWRVGSVFGIPLLIDPSWFFILVLVAVPRGMLWNEQYPQWGMVTAYVAGALMAVLLFGSVLLHELGHSLVARAQGIKVNSITLFLFGGVASIEQESKTPGKAFQVAVAGPAVSFGLFALLRGLMVALPASNSPTTVLIDHLSTINLVLGLFNLIPGLPLDGGQILKATVWKVTGDRFKGIHWAARSGRILGWAAVILGVWTFLMLGASGGLWIALLGWFGIQNASNYDRITNLQEALLKIKASDAMVREFRVVDADMTLRRFADEYLLNPSRISVYFAAADGRYRGMVAVDDLHTIERSEWDTSTLNRITQPLSSIPSVQENSAIVDVIQLLEAQKLRWITVLSPAGAVSGVIDRGDIIRALAEKLNIQISETLIKQIKEEGTYPPELNLEGLARTAAEAETVAR